MSPLSIGWRRYSVPFRHLFATGAGPISRRDGLLLRLSASDGAIGWGDCAPHPVFGGDLAACLSAVGTLVGGLDEERLRPAISALASSAATAPLACALDTARLDVAAQRRDRPIAALLAENWRDILPTNAVISDGSVDAMVFAIRDAIAAGFCAVKVKVGSGTPACRIERITRAREAAAGHRLRIDANGSWSVADARVILSAASGLGIEYVEQPLHVGEEGELQRLRESGVPIALDESAATLDQIRAITAGALADVVILKPMVLGGPSRTRQAIDLLEGSGIAPVVTTTIDSGVGIAAALHCAAGVRDSQIAHGLATAALLVDDLTGGSPVIDSGQIRIPWRSGLGVLPSDTYVSDGNERQR